MERFLERLTDVPYDGFYLAWSEALGGLHHAHSMEFLMERSATTNP